MHLRQGCSQLFLCDIYGFFSGIIDVLGISGDIESIFGKGRILYNLDRDSRSNQVTEKEKTVRIQLRPLLMRNGFISLSAHFAKLEVARVIRLNMKLHRLPPRDCPTSYRNSYCYYGNYRQRSRVYNIVSTIYSICKCGREPCHLTQAGEEHHGESTSNTGSD